MSAIGAARISGQGVATTNTASARTGSPENAQASKATTVVRGRKKAAYRSAIRTNGARCSPAWVTSRTSAA